MPVPVPPRRIPQPLNHPEPSLPLPRPPLHRSSALKLLAAPAIATAQAQRAEEKQIGEAKKPHRRDEAGEKRARKEVRTPPAREDVFPAAAEGARVGRGRCGGGDGGGGEAAVPDDAGEPAAAVGVHPEGVHHPLHPDVAHHRRRLRRCLRTPRRPLLRLHPRRLRPLHLPHHPPLHRALPAVLLLPAPPGEPPPAGALHGGDQLRRGSHLRVHQGGGDPRVGDPDRGGGGEPDGVHVLGGAARPRLQLPRPVPLRRRHDPHGVRAHPDLLPAGEDLADDLWRPCGARVLRLHRVRYG